MFIKEQDREDIFKYFGLQLEELDAPKLKEIHKKLRIKYHPDNFAKFEDDTIKEMATERFQRIEELVEKIENYWSNTVEGSRPKSPTPQASQPSNIKDHGHPFAQFSANMLKMEVITSDKDLKYRLFGKQYKWLTYGDEYVIPNTEASIVIDNNHQGSKIGFQESIKMYLTFDETNQINAISLWLANSLEHSSSKLIIGGNACTPEAEHIDECLRQLTFKRIGTAKK